MPKHAREALAGALLATALLTAVPAGAATPAERCRIARYKASARYLLCQQIALARDVSSGTLVIGTVSDAYRRTVARCRLRYATAWARMQASIIGAAKCSGARFVDTGSGTITDALTGLEWEKKTDDGSIHDKDNVYSWSASGSASDGTAFTTFLATLNGGCFAGRCDWRLPTQAELQTILDGTYPCTTCTDPIFAPFVAAPHLTGTEHGDHADLAHDVSFLTGASNTVVKTGIENVRAVRAGL